MAHRHSIYDTDPHFKIDGKTRVVTNVSETKSTIFQYDHNSERFTFELPRLIDGHDMTLCDIIQVHYININASTRERYSDIYKVTDAQVSPNDPNVMICSWLVSNQATQYVGPLNFILRFICSGDDGNPEYVWGTAIHSGITVSASINNGEEIVANYSDILVEWERQLFGIGDTEEQVIKNASASEQEAITARGEAVLATIPDEYTDLSNKANESVRTKADAIRQDVQGSVISVNDSSDDYLRGLRVFGKTEQVTTTGKNLCSLNNIKFVQHVVVELDAPIPAGTYYLSMTAKSSDVDQSVCVINFYNGSTKIIGVNFERNTRFIQQFTCEQDITHLYLYASNSYQDGAGDTATFSDIMISTESEVSYEPYSGGTVSPSPDCPQDLVSVVNPTVKIRGKNLIDIGTVTIDGYKLYNVDLPAGTYTLSASVVSDDADDAESLVVIKPSDDSNIYLRFTRGDRQAKTFTSNLPIARLDVYAGNNYATSLGDIATWTDVQLELGDTTTDYEPYMEQILTVPHTLPGIPVSSDGNYADENGQQWVCDEVDFERGVYIQRIAKHVFNGSESWNTYSSNNPGGQRFRNESVVDKIKRVDDANKKAIALCTALPVLSANRTYLLTQGISVEVNGGLSVYAADYAGDVDAWKAYLTSNPMELIYALATPIETELSDAELNVFRETISHYHNTIVMNDADAHMEVSYNADTKIYLQGEAADILAYVVEEITNGSY